MMLLPVDVPVGVGGRMSARVLLGWRPPVSIWCAACPAVFSGLTARARREGTTLRGNLLQGLARVCRRNVVPTPRDTVPESALHPCAGPTGRRSREDDLVAAATRS
jgi:hypothetical protein